MSVYMVERELPGISMGQLADAQADVVKQVNDTAKIPYTRVVEAMDLTP